MQHAQHYTKWNLPHGAKARLGKGRINRLQYSPDGSQFAVFSRIGIWIYDAYTNKEVTLLTPNQSARTTELNGSWTGKRIHQINWDHPFSVSLWDTQVGIRNIPLKGPTEEIRSIALSPDSKTLASGGYDNAV
ncbi:hypothetical protein F4083_07055 [Candidatus Poribacteria bacterium]|nr:hypothetical protein [Candidatus Poribacteria bacterium]MYI94071.1 hypothetical protein [Candidatus Poribacteria bacterium]